MKLKQQMLEAIRTQGKARATFDTYWPWCRSYLIFTMKDGEFVHPKETGEPEVKAWLTYLANRRHVAAGTQNTAMQAVLFMYRHVLGRPLVGIDALRAKQYETVPTVLSIGEVQRLFNELSGIPLIVAQIMYASGLRIGEVLNLRIKDLDPDRSQIIIRCAKGKKDRVTCYPDSLQQLLDRRIRSARVRWEGDIDEGYKGVPLPDAFWRKSPKAATEWSWFWLLPSPVLSKSPETGEMLRGKLDSSNIGRAIKNAAKRAGITKRVTSHGLRHAFATHLHETGVGLRVIQRLLGHSHVETTEIYVHVSKDAASSTRSPLENILANPNNNPRKTEKPKAAEPFKLRVVG